MIRERSPIAPPRIICSTQASSGNPAILFIKKATKERETNKPIPYFVLPIFNLFYLFNNSTNLLKVRCICTIFIVKRKLFKDARIIIIPTKIRNISMVYNLVNLIIPTFNRMILGVGVVVKG